MHDPHAKLRQISDLNWHRKPVQIKRGTVNVFSKFVVVNVDVKTSFSCQPSCARTCFESTWRFLREVFQTGALDHTWENSDISWGGSCLYERCNRAFFSSTVCSEVVFMAVVYPRLLNDSSSGRAVWGVTWYHVAGRNFRSCFQNEVVLQFSARQLSSLTWFSPYNPLGQAILKIDAVRGMTWMTDDAIIASWSAHHHDGPTRTPVKVDGNKQWLHTPYSGYFCASLTEQWSIV